MPTKKSVGTILCRVRAATGRVEALLVLKRYTYAFAEFVHGRFSRGRGWAVTRGGAALPRGVLAMLEQMSTEELLDVWSLDFRLMWRRVWLAREPDDFYHKKHAKFMATFMREDGGEALRNAVQQTRGRGVCLWEVPKGRHVNAREADVICAVRELREETGIDKSAYRILPGVKRRVAYVSSGTRYVCIYYIAVAYPSLAESRHAVGRPSLRAVGDMGEVGETRWYDIERVRLLDDAGARLEPLIAPAFRLVKKYLRGQWAARRPLGGMLAAALPPLVGPALGGAGGEPPQAEPPGEPPAGPTAGPSAEAPASSGRPERESAALGGPAGRWPGANRPASARRVRPQPPEPGPSGGQPRAAENEPSPPAGASARERPRPAPWESAGAPRESASAPRESASAPVTPVVRDRRPSHPGPERRRGPPASEHWQSSAAGGRWPSPPDARRPSPGGQDREADAAARGPRADNDPDAGWHHVRRGRRGRGWDAQ